MADGNYWTGGRVGRRSVIRGASLGLTGLAGAALIGCGGEEGGGRGAGGGQVGATAARGGLTVGGTAPAATPASGATPVPPDQVRVKPGLYEGPVGASPAEANPMVNAKPGGTLRLRYLDPPRMDLNRTLSCTIYHTLNYTNNKLWRGRTGAAAEYFKVEFEPDLAQSLEVTDNNQTYIFKLHQGVKTHNKPPVNGREFTSEDVVAALEMYRAGGTQKDVYSPVDSIEAPDDHTVVLKMKSPIAGFEQNMASWSFIYLKELVEDENLRQEQAIGTGPFVQDQWIKKEKSVFSKHPDYFEEGLPFLDGVEVAAESDASTLRAGFDTGNFFDWNARDDKDAEAMFAARGDTMVFTKVPRSRGANVNGFQYQMKNPIYEDERVRRALSLAIDRAEFDLADNAGDNQNPEGPYSNAPMPWPFLFDNYPTMAANGPWYQFDPEQASQLMQAAGYSTQSPLAFEMQSWYYRSELSELVIPMINQNLPEAKITFRQVDNPTHVTMMSDRNFTDVVGFLWGPPGYAMDQWIFPFYHSTAGNNYGSVNDPELDALLEKQRQETDPAAQKEVWQQVWDRLHDQVYQVWLPEALTRIAWHNYMLNYRDHGLMGSYTCYSNDQARAIWLEDSSTGRSAPGVSERQPRGASS
jgi:peptide/nickel transport system substrate-binding protein